MSIKINTIYNENCLDTMARMPDEFVDLTVTSPPYDDLRDYKGYVFPFEDIAKELLRVTKRGGVVVWVVGDATIDGDETGTSFRQALFFKQIGFKLHDTMIYAKDTVYPRSNAYTPAFEYMFVFVKDFLKTFNPIRVKKPVDLRRKFTTSRQRDGQLVRRTFTPPTGAHTLPNIWYFSTGRSCSASDDVAFEHPAIFPEQLAECHIRSWSDEGDLVYDPFGGSGTVAKMAVLLDRNFIISEISEEYCDIIRRRLELPFVKSAGRGGVRRFIED